MFEKLIDTIVLLIAALQENTAARRDSNGSVVAMSAPSADVPSVVSTSSAPPKPPRRKAETPPPQDAEPMPDFGGVAEAKKSMTKEEANEVLVNEWKRLGANANATQKINDLFAEFGVPGLLKLPAKSYADFCTKAQALL